MSHLRAFSVCPACCQVHAAGAPCPTCEGVPEPADTERSAVVVFNPPRPRRPLAVRALGLGLVLVAVLGAVTLLNV